MATSTTRTNSIIVVAATLASTWSFFAGGANAMDITISAGKHARPAGPVCFRPHERLDHEQLYHLVNPKGGHTPIAQVDHDGRLWWWAPAMEAGRSTNYKLKPLPPGKELLGIVVEKKKTDGLIEVTAHAKPFTALNFKKNESKVYLYPVIGPTGDPVTRDYPMKDNPIEKNQDKSRQDHHHHRSIWCAHGIVRTDNFDGSGNYWHEPEPAKQDRQKLRRIVRMVSGPVFGQIEAEIEWVTHTGVRQFTEFRTYTFFAGEKERIIDVKNVFKFSDSDVTFGDTKEGGILSIRTAVTLDERGIKNPRQMHGQMTNIHGQKGESQCWGKAAAWCDYVGPVLSRDAETTSTVGIAVLDHPKNFRHPTRWHIRGYGLYTANPFAWSQFMKGEGKDGSHTWKKGETADFNYRILIHKDDTKAARVADHWKLYSDPPKVTAK